MIYWRDYRDSLKRLFDFERVGLITDMDGTLSPIVPVPDDAAPTTRNRQLLKALSASLALVAVVSGRAVDDLYKRVNLPELVYAGNHGLERWRDGEVVPTPQAADYRPNLEAVIEMLEPQLPDGMWIEDKRATLSLHYRDTANPTQTADAYATKLQTIAESHDLRVFEGRMIFELRPPLDIDKGTVFKQLIAEYDLQAALYLGDDTTDADALKMAQQLRQDNTCYALALGIESDETPQDVLTFADALIAGVSDVESFLDWLLTASKASIN